jgi:hypothetical protein
MAGAAPETIKASASAANREGVEEILIGSGQLADTPVYFADGTATSIRVSGTGVSPVNTRKIRVPLDKH